jgi:hypothetical protein
MKPSKAFTRDDLFKLTHTNPTLPLSSMTRVTCFSRYPLSVDIVYYINQTIVDVYTCQRRTSINNRLTKNTQTTASS